MRADTPSLELAGLDFFWVCLSLPCGLGKAPSLSELPLFLSITSQCLCTAPRRAVVRLTGVSGWM